ncbi:hypothetical protein CHS0354_012185 [Potamilus streckersoni]|uniref:EF-hand domain-containing protein n=1 Tax=Potamilus streckersoni TaxID=2493646 RepID=A0AAE0SAP7_9BIVA|nr:hypothetical protein CHS0354_012185 [Potamilus streckersoni]
MSLTPEQCEQFWTYADADGDGSLTIHELKAGLHKFLAEKNQGEVQCIPDSVIVEIFTDLDKDGNKRISKEEFLQEMMLPHRRETLKAEFMKLCDPVTRKMGRAEVAKMCQATKSYSGEDIEKILQEADINGDGQIDLDEFLAACS